MRWRLGNESSINIWTQPWIRNKDKYYVSSKIPFGLEHLTVSSLIDFESNRWKSDIVGQIFNDGDSRDITRMPILNPQELDILIWKASTSGSYTVRSAYHILMETMIKNQV